MSSPTIRASGGIAILWGSVNALANGANTNNTINGLLCETPHRAYVAR